MDMNMLEDLVAERIVPIQLIREISVFFMDSLI